MEEDDIEFSTGWLDRLGGRGRIGIEFNAPTTSVTTEAMNRFREAISQFTEATLSEERMKKMELKDQIERYDEAMQTFKKYKEALLAAEKKRLREEELLVFTKQGPVPCERRRIVSSRRKTVTGHGQSEFLAALDAVEQLLRAGSSIPEEVLNTEFSEDLLAASKLGECDEEYRVTIYL